MNVPSNNDSFYSGSSPSPLSPDQTTPTSTSPASHKRLFKKQKQSIIPKYLQRKAQQIQAQEKNTPTEESSKLHVTNHVEISDKLRAQRLQTYFPSN